MIWGSFTWSGLCSVTLCSNRMESQKYLNILGDHPQVNFYFPDRSGIFQDDNARIHQSNVVQDWFRHYEGSFSHMKQPPQFPDLNLIENSRDQLERLASLNTSSFFIERSIETFARTLDRYSFRLFAKSCKIYA